MKHYTSIWSTLLLLFACIAGGLSAEAQVEADGRGQVRVLFAGDSLMESLGSQVEPALAQHLHWHCLPIGKKSTGLCRPDVYNWPVVLENNLRTFRPHLVVMWVGTNDNQNIYGEKTGGLLTPAWKNAYHRKMLAIITLCRKHHARLIFMGPPTVGKPGDDAQLAQISEVMRVVCRHHQVPFLDVRPIFADKQGGYVQRLADRNGQWVDIRTRDRVHITSAGNNLVMKKLYPLMRTTLNTSLARRGTRATSIRGSRATTR